VGPSALAGYHMELIDVLLIRTARTGLAHAYDVIEIRVPNKKNFQFGVMGLS